MSSIANNDILSVCANCGKGEESYKLLKSCTACKMVKYCNRDCQIAHRPQHKKECKKRAAELHDEELFKQPPSQYGDCPICFLRMPFMNSGSRYQSCCGKVICSGCFHAPVYDHEGNEVDNDKQNACAFCRVVAPKTENEMIQRLNKRVEAEDANAIYNLGIHYRDGSYGFPQDMDKALELWQRAAELGLPKAYGSIGYSYNNGRGLEIDKKKATYYYELAAIGGCVQARHNLGCSEGMAGNTERALKHYRISVGGGHSKSLGVIKQMYTKGDATKDDYTKALQSYQKYLSEIKSTQRDTAAAVFEDCRYY